MKIAFIGQKGIFGKSGGGVESHVEDLALALAEKGHSVIVYVRPYYCRFKINKIRKYKGVTLIKLPTIRTKHFDAITHTFLASLDVLRRDVDIIHYHMIGPASLVWIPKIFKRRARVIFTYHSQDYYHKKWGKFARQFLKLGEWIGCNIADEVISVSKNIKRYIDEQYNINASYIPNGVKDPTLLKPNLIKKWGLKKNNYILSVARMIPHKNLHLLLGAYQNLMNKYPDKKLVIVGGGTYTDLYEKYLTHYSKKNRNIILAGQLPNNSVILRELFSNAYVYAHPSEAEGLSIAILEAGSFGIPILASDIIENRDVLEDDAFYFENKDMADLKNKLEHLIINPRSLAVKKKKLKQTISSVYSWDNLVEQILTTYRLSAVAPPTMPARPPTLPKYL